MPTHEDTIIAEWLDAHGHGELAWEWQFPSNEFVTGKKPNDFTQPAPLLAAMEAYLKSRDAIWEFWVYFKQAIAGFSSEITVGEDTVAFKSNPRLAVVLCATLAAIEAEKGES